MKKQTTSKAMMSHAKRTSSTVMFFAMLMAMFLSATQIFAQSQVTVTGQVVDAATKQPLVGVTCVVNNGQSGTTTNADGIFTLQMRKGPKEKEILFSYLGYQEQTILWTGQTSLNIELAEESTAVDEVIVVGYGTQKKSDITGAVGSVAKDRIEKMISTDIAQMMQGAVPGLNIMATSAGADPEGQSGLMLIRGRNSISASNDPLIILDGVPYWGTLSDISPTDIASIEVLKDASSAAIYGSRGANGVILINTRQGKEGNVKITYDAFYAVQTVANYPDIMNGEEYYQYKKSWDDADDADPDATLSGTEAEAYADGSWKNWSWKDLLTRTGSSMRHSISASGGSKSVKYHVGLNYLTLPPCFDVFRRKEQLFSPLF